MFLNIAMCIIALLSTFEKCPVRHLHYFEGDLDVICITHLHLGKSQLPCSTLVQGKKRTNTNLPAA